MWIFYVRKEVLEAVRKRKRDSIALEAKRSSGRLRQRARRAVNSVRAADAARDRERWAALSEVEVQKMRAANTSRDRERRAVLLETDRQNIRAADAARHHERWAEETANDGCAGSTFRDFDAQAKQKNRDFISPSNMGRDTCACCNE